MASSLEFVQYVADQLALAGTITFRKMFGEYGLFCDGKFFATVEDNGLYLKITPAGHELLPQGIIASPHEGAHFFFIENLEDREFLAHLVRSTCAQLPEKKPRKKKETSTRL